MTLYYKVRIQKNESDTEPEQHVEFKSLDMYGKTSTLDETAEDDHEIKPKPLII